VLVEFPDGRHRRFRMANALADFAKLGAFLASSGYQYESFSNDGGDTWTELVPSRFVSSNFPGAFLRLRDGRMILARNNCMGPESRDGILSSYNRQILVAAIGADEGESWQGYREIGRIQNGKWQISYPVLIQVTDGIILCSGLAGPDYLPQGVIRVHPDWLTGTGLTDDFEKGLDNWVIPSAARG
jgi:hypothetical protein